MSDQNAPLLSDDSDSSNNQPINQPINQPAHYAGAEPQFGSPVNQSINQPMNQQYAQHPGYAQPVHQGYDPSINQPMYAQPVQQGYDPSINQPMYAQPAPYGYNPSMNQPINQPAGYPAYGTAPVVTMVPIPVGQPGHIQTFGHFSDGLFDCLNSPLICVLSWLLPCYRWPSTVARVGLMSFAMAALVYSGLYFGAIILSIVDTAVYGPNDGMSERPVGSTLIGLVTSALGLCAVSLGAYHRVKLRERYQIVGSGFGDWCTYFWCSCCAIAQEARHVDRDYGLIL